jgi:hypothetical protein
MKRSTAHTEVINEVYNLFNELGLGPERIPEKSFQELRGGVTSYNFTKRKNIEAGVLVSKFELGDEDGFKRMYKIEYALRGTLKGIEKGKAIALTSHKLSGFLNKRVEQIGWITPKNRFEYNIRHVEPPTLGEVWSGSPYVRIIESLNLNTDLIEEIVHFLNLKRKPEMKILAHSDNWGESIRVNSTLWVPKQEVKKVYVDTKYIEIVGQIINIIKTVRKDFGGLTI